MKDVEGTRPKSTWKIVVAVVCVLGGAFWLWEEVLEYHVLPKRWRTVEEGSLYRSGQLTDTLVERTLEKHGITVIVDLTHEVPGDEYQQAERQAADDLGIRHTRFPLKGDGTGKIENYADAIEELVRSKRAGERVLVHCAAGVQRTGGVLAFYRLLVEQRSPDFVLHELRRNWWRPNDNPALPQFINAHIEELALLLQERGVIEEIPDPLPTLPL
jgi:predicted protein tyrosine phosphatase